MRDISMSLSGGINAPSARAFLQFVEFLDDLKPPMFVEKALSYVLRTTPPIYVTTEGLLDLVSAWAEDRSTVTGRPVSELYLGATRKIIDAYRSNAIKDFDPKVFYRPFTEGLLQRCPEAQRPDLAAGLVTLTGEIQRRWANAEEPEYEETDVVVVNGRAMTHLAASGELVGRIEGAGALTDAEFDAVLADLDRVLVTRVGTPVRSYLERLVIGAVALLNGGRLRRSSRIFALVDEIAHRFDLEVVDRDLVWGYASVEKLDPTVLARLANDPSRQAEVGVFVRCLPALRPEQALSALEHERSRDRRRFLLKVLELHGADALGPILARFDEQAQRGPLPWYFTRNLVYALSRMEVAFEADRRRVVEAVGPSATSEQPQLRSAALATLKRLAAQGLAAVVVPHASRALDPAAYPPGDEAGREALFRHLGQALELLVATGEEEALEVVAEVATGQRGAEFHMGQQLKGLAIAQLGQRRGPLPRRPALAVVGHLAQVADRRIKLVVGRLALGVDVAACRALVGLIQDSPEPEARALLSTPMMRKIAAR